MIYYIVFLALLMLAILFDFYEVKPKMADAWFYIFICICLFLMAALRSETGYDYVSYKQIFFKVKNGEADFLSLYHQVGYEPGFFGLMYILRCFSFETFIFFVSAICIIPKVYFIYRLGVNKYMMLFCYYCSVFISYDMGIIRQGIALSILLYSVKYIKKRSLVKFLIIVFIAALFHTSSVIFIAAYFLGERETKDSIFVFSIIIAVGLSIVLKQNVVYELIGAVAKRIPFIGNKIVDLIHFYNVAPQYAQQSFGVIGIIKRIIELFIFMLLRFLGENQKNSESNQGIFNISLNCYFMSVLLVILLGNNGLMASRGTYALYMFQIPCFGLSVGDNKSEHFYHTIILVICVVLFYSTFYGLVNDPIEAYLPYETIFDKNNFIINKIY